MDKALIAMCVGDSLRLGDETIDLPRHKTSQWDFGKVWSILHLEGQWDHTLGQIRHSALMAAMRRFSQPVRDKLEKARIETRTEPSISEAAKHGRRVVTKVNMRGVS